jgi:hypothetical protein
MIAKVKRFFLLIFITMLYISPHVMCMEQDRPSHHKTCTTIFVAGVAIGITWWALTHKYQLPYSNDTTELTTNNQIISLFNCTPSFKLSHNQDLHQNHYQIPRYIYPHSLVDIITQFPYVKQNHLITLLDTPHPIEHPVYTTQSYAKHISQEEISCISYSSSTSALDNDKCTDQLIIPSTNVQENTVTSIKPRKKITRDPSRNAVKEFQALALTHEALFDEINDTTQHDDPRHVALITMLRISRKRYEQSMGTTYESIKRKRFRDAQQNLDDFIHEQNISRYVHSTLCTKIVNKLHPYLETFYIEEN